jgi:glycosyltransferase involved in cell wall biosynthesis
MRLSLVIDGLGPGGAEAVLTFLAGAWADQGHSVTLLTFAGQDEAPFRPLASAIRRVGLNVRTDSRSILEGIANNFHRVRTLRAALRASRPDVVIAFCDRVNILTLLAARGLNLPVIVAERVDPASHAIGAVWDWLRRLTYPGAGQVIVQSKRFVDAIPRAARARTMVIPNPVVPAGRTIPVGRHPVRLVALGRLTSQKGFDVLIQSVATVVARHQDLSLVIFGEGPARATLLAQVEALGLGARVRLPGLVSGPTAAFAPGDIFVMPSRYEGFPNALCEAMAHGVPVIASDTGAVAEIVRNDVDGILVPPEDSTALAAAIERLLTDGELRLRLATRAPEVVSRFSRERVLSLWDGAISAARNSFAKAPAQVR